MIWGLYVDFVKASPLASSAVQVGALGTFGEMLGSKLRGRGFLPFTWRQTAMKVVVWAFLGVSFKYAFTGFGGFYDALVAKQLWYEPWIASVSDPSLPIVISPWATWWRSLSISTFTNLLFGPVMMLFHRWTDNWIEKNTMNWTTMVSAWKSLVWFWIPAHTLTFASPQHFQVGLAALWAVALGVILSLFARQGGK